MSSPRRGCSCKGARSTGVGGGIGQGMPLPRGGHAHSAGVDGGIRGGRTHCGIGGTGIDRQTPASDGMPARSTSPSHWTPQPSSRAQSDQRGSSLPISAYKKGAFTADFGSTVRGGAGIDDGRHFFLLRGIGRGKLSSSLRDALSFAPHNGVIFSLLPTL